jgi:hypothetical protein
MFSLEAIFERRKDCVLFDPVTLKYLTGKSQASKQDIQKFVQLDTVNPDSIQSDEADAYCIAKFATRFMMVKDGILNPDDLSKYEKRVFLERTRKRKGVNGKPMIKRIAHVFRENSRFFSFSRVPKGRVDLPNKIQINSSLLEWIDS